jgi:hypothetical protein
MWHSKLPFVRITLVDSAIASSISFAVLSGMVSSRLSSIWVLNASQAVWLLCRFGWFLVLQYVCWWWRLLVCDPTADVPLPLGSRTVPGLSCQLLIATDYNDWTPAVLWLELRVRVRVRLRVRIRATSRLAVYRQLVRLGDKPLEVHDQ